MQSLMRNTTTHQRCRSVQEEVASLGPVTSALDHSVGSSRILVSQFTVPQRRGVTSGPAANHSPRTTVTVPHSAHNHHHATQHIPHHGNQCSIVSPQSQEQGRMQKVTESTSSVLPHKVGWRTIAVTKKHLKHPYQGALVFQNRSLTQKSPFVHPFPSPATFLLLQLIASTLFLQLLW